MERISVINQKEFFKEILNKNKTSLRDISRKLGISYSILKKASRGESTIPKEIFVRLVKYSEKPDYWESRSIAMNKFWAHQKEERLRFQKLLRTP